MADSLMYSLFQDYGRRADQLNLKEKELRSKEAELRKLEQDLRSSGGLKPEKNWPPCCAFTHHDIAGEVDAPSVQLLANCLKSRAVRIIIETLMSG